jgi:pimeloyl-ACP methyl ester carboxylesterase
MMGARARTTVGVMATEEQTRFRSFDGLKLAGTITVPGDQDRRPAAVLVHGGGVTRDEAGFFTRLAAGVAAAGIPVLRFDLRGHGESEGRQEDLTICAVANDISAAISHIRDQMDSGPAHLYGTSFGGGISAFFTARHPLEVQSLTLANPLLDYRKRFVDDKPYWHGGHIDEAEGQLLAERGYLGHSATFRLGRALLNEVSYVNPRAELPELTVPTLFLHGTGDTFVPVESSRAAVSQVTRAEVRLVEIDGAQHGFAVHDDPEYQQSQTAEWQEFVISTVTSWMVDHS